MGDAETPKPSGPAEVCDALIEAALELITEEGLHFGVRQVAERANVNHGLVHRYFGSKAGLVTAALDRYTERLEDRLDPDGRPGEAVWDALPEMAILYARVAIDPSSEADLFTKHPVMNGWAASIRSEDPERSELAAKAEVAVAASLALGWGLYRRLFMQSVGATQAEAEAIEAEVRRRFWELGRLDGTP